MDLDIDVYDDEWTPDDDEPMAAADADTADKYLRWLNRAEAEVAKIEDAFNAEIAKLEARREDLTAGPRRRATELVELLEGYARALREEDPKFKKLDLPHGTISTRAGSKKIEIVDEDEVFEWWNNLPDEDHPDFDQRRRLPIVHTVTTTSISKSEIKTLIAAGSLVVVGDEGMMVDLLTSEIMPGIVQTTGPIGVTVKIV